MITRVVAAAVWVGALSWMQASPVPHQDGGALATAKAPPKALKPPISIVKSKFTELGLVFHSAPLADGTPRLMGASADSQTQVELIGANNRLEGLSLWMPAEATSPDVAKRNAAAIAIVMTQTGWKDGIAWLAAVIAKGNDEKTTHGGVVYEFSTVSGIRFLNADPA